MDEALKARLVGATVLVALAVLFIPELLSGRKPESTPGPAPATARGTRTYTIELAAQPSASAKAQPAPVSQASPQVSGASAEAAVAPATVPQATAKPTNSPRPAPKADKSSPAQAPVSTPAAKPLPQETRAAAAPATATPPKGGWAVQVGAFASAATADKLVQELRSAGYKAYASSVFRSGKTLYRVRVGPEAERARAEGLAASLKGRGLPATVVAND